MRLTLVYTKQINKIIVQKKKSQLEEERDTVGDFFIFL